MTPGTSWLTIFSREAQHAKVARFQIGLVEKGEADDVFVSMLACLIEASARHPGPLGQVPGRARELQGQHRKGFD